MCLNVISKLYSVGKYDSSSYLSRDVNSVIMGFLKQFYAFMTVAVLSVLLYLTHDSLCTPS
jgi:hypothetical protein